MNRPLVTPPAGPELGDVATLRDGRTGILVRIDNRCWGSLPTTAYVYLASGAWVGAHLDTIQLDGNDLATRAAAFAAARLAARSSVDAEVADFIARRQAEHFDGFRLTHDPASQWGEFKGGRPATDLAFWTAVLKVETSALWHAAKDQAATFTRETQ